MAAGLTVRQIVVADAAPTRVDATAVALPLLLALTGCVVTARIVPVVLGAILPRLRKRPGVALFTGAAIVARGPGGTAVTLLAALIAVAVALFGSVLGTTLASGLEAAGRASVGSSIAVAADTLDDDVITGLGRLPGVASSVEIANEDDVTVANRGVQLPATVVIADTARLATVQRGVPGTFPIPGGLRKTTNGIPVVISQALADRLGGKSSQIAGTRLDVVAVEPSQTALTKSSEWILVDADQAEAIGESFGSANLALLRLEPGADPRAVAGAAVRATGDASLVDTAQEAIDRLSENPLVPGMRALSLVASALAGAVGILALLLATLQETPARRARIALLSMLGLDRRQARRILAVESLPIGLAALVGGAAVAVAIVALVLPAIDLRSFTGSAERPPLAVDPLVVVSILVGGLVAVAAVTLVTIRTTSIRGVDRRLAPEE
ncbi:hypothetical protein GCM10025867_35220 [Frondihabitans sucicola]|uniref:ABC3 transporter permease C-terminal domain-containing protein n=1 Tax=Frondihabitans sucicola TaxID=1268041 RepID=A0ABM8GS48_9MICO|nr:FtsX-like permease family protein [Frondihabitans sucicola]BDZ51281.1 hypothetical protein GCM10025867_35220 [Frondihabitans sucicola]